MFGLGNNKETHETAALIAQYLDKYCLEFDGNDYYEAVKEMEKVTSLGQKIHFDSFVSFRHPEVEDIDFTITKCDIDGICDELAVKGENQYAGLFMHVSHGYKSVYTVRRAPSAAVKLRVLFAQDYGYNDISHLMK